VISLALASSPGAPLEAAESITPDAFGDVADLGKGEILVWISG